MTQQPTPDQILGNREVAGSYATYQKAERAVDFLSDNGFPVDRAAIVGSDLHMVETVLGRLTRGRAALAGAGSGAWFGLLVGLVMSLFSTERQAFSLVLLGAVALGAAFGALFGFTAHAMTGGRRDFVSRSSIVASRYDVVVDTEVTEDAKNLLIKLSWRED